MEETTICEALACHGHVRWDDVLADDAGGTFPPKHRAGFCDCCMALHIECGECGVVDSYDTGEPIIACAGDCGIRWEIDYEKCDVVGFRELPLRPVRASG